MISPYEAIIVPPSANDTIVQMEKFVRINDDATQKSMAMQSALADVKANIEDRKAEEALHTLEYV